MPLKPDEKLYLSFLTEAPMQENAEKLFSFSNKSECFYVADKQVYVKCLKDGRKLNFSNNFIEGILKVSATTRNFNTVLKLATNY